MGRNARGGLSRTVNLRPSPTNSSRKVKLPLMERVERLLRGKVIPTPLWYDAMKAHPPAERYTRTSKPRMMEFPEDRLKRVWLRRNPAATLHPKVLFHEESSFSPSELEHPADGFVRRQMELMRKGMGEEEAYRKVLDVSQLGVSDD